MFGLRASSSGCALARRWWLLVCFLSLAAPMMFAQLDQGAITGVVTDITGAVIPNAKVTLTATGTGFAQERTTNASGIYVFAPVKIGNYQVTVEASGFKKTTRENVHIGIQERVNVNLSLSPGNVADSVTVTAEAPLLQSQTASVGQAMGMKQIEATPLNGRNWVYLAQLTPGVAPPMGGTRGSGKGDFIANGQRAEQNNFILDGVDNNTHLVDFLNGSSYVIRPPSDALAEFNIQTSNYSAEFGHSAGAVMNASVKSGSNAIHGSLWEYLRSDKLNAQNWNAKTKPKYHQNQFGGTLGLPIIKNKLFYFGDIEGTRVSMSNPGLYSVPTAKMRNGDFTELLDKTLTSSGKAIDLYQPGTGGTTLLTCNGQANVFCANQINPVAQNLLKMYPMPNTNDGKVYNNYALNLPKHDNTVSWDQRLDYNISPNDQVYGRYSYSHGQVANELPLGPILDGGGYGGYLQSNLAQNVMLSETHVFNPTTTNELRFGYNWGVFRFLQANATENIAPKLGLGGVPYRPYQGGLPWFYVGGITSFGSSSSSNEKQNVYQILDNVTKIAGNHALKFGVALQNVRFYYTYASAPRGQYQFNGRSTSLPGTPNTGWGVADFLANQMNWSYISLDPDIYNQRWYDSAFAQDDWRVTPKLTLNLGLRWDYYQPYGESQDRQVNFYVNGPLSPGHGSGVFEIPQSAPGGALYSGFVDALTASNVQVQKVKDARLINTQKTNFAPRIGFAYSLTDRMVVRGGFGIFYGGLQNEGNSNLGANYPFGNTASINGPTCTLGSCPSNGMTLETGFGPQLANGIMNFISNPGFHAIDKNVKTPYTENYNLSVQYGITKDMVADVSYVGNVSRHLSTYFAINSPMALYRSGESTQNLLPFPTLGGIGAVQYSGVSSYNSLQAKVEKRYSHGLTFLGTYTWAHALDDTSNAGGLSSGVGMRQYYLLGVGGEYTNSPYDVRHRVTFTGNYELPFGRGKAYLSNSSGVVNAFLGGWSTSMTFVAQTGTPFTVNGNVPGPAGGSGHAILVRDPYAPGGTQDPTNPGITCATSTRNKEHWFNPCAFANPAPGNLICPVNPDPLHPVPCTYPAGVTDPKIAAMFFGGQANQLYGPGYWTTNMSLFKSFKTIREQSLQFRVDAFNLFNHPTWGNPSGNINSSGGLITGTKSFQANTPDARFLQLSLKYVF